MAIRIEYDDGSYSVCKTLRDVERYVGNKSKEGLDPQSITGEVSVQGVWLTVGFGDDPVKVNLECLPMNVDVKTTDGDESQ